MKYVKMLGLAAVAAMALMAFLGASSASATVICKTEVDPCPAGWMVSTGEEVSASLSGTATLETLEGTVLDTCTEGSVAGPTEQTGSSTETLSFKFEKAKLTWGGCSKTTDTVEGGTIEFHFTKKNTATITINNAQVTVNTIFGSCVYGYGSAYKDLGTIVGGKPAKMEINTIVPKISGSLCPAEARWTASYSATAPNSGTLFPTEG